MLALGVVSAHVRKRQRKQSCHTIACTICNTYRAVTYRVYATCDFRYIFTVYRMILDKNLCFPALDEISDEISEIVKYSEYLAARNHV